MDKPRLFIGSSVEGLSVAYGIQDNLKFDTETTVWTQGVFNLSESSLESLLSQLDNSDFSVFVFTPDDIIKIRGKKDLTVRDNVLFELGLFIGRLGRKRCYIVIPDNKIFHLPTDLIGVTPGKYEATRTDNNLLAATGSVSNKIKEAIIKNGCLSKSNDGPEIKIQIDDKTKKINVEKDWYELLIEKDYDSAIKSLKRKIKSEKDKDEKISLMGYLCYAIYQKDPIKGKQEYEKLIQENKTNNLSYLAYANLLFWNNSFPKALEIIEEGLLKCQRKITLTILKVDCLWETNQKDPAISFLIESMNQLNDPSLNLKLATLYIKNEQKTEALEKLYQGYHDYPTDKDLVSQFAKVAYDLGHKDVSILLYKDLLSIDPENSEYLCLMGNSYLDLKLYNLALTSYEKANEIVKEKKSWILGNIGNLYNNKELFDKA
jgi:hypothetical protein